MARDYRFRDLPWDLPEDAPTWRTWTEALRLGLHQGAPGPAQVARAVEYTRADRVTRRTAFARRPGLDPDTPVATYAGFDKRLNVGHGTLLACHYITDVTVRASDRRRGLLRALLTRDLADAKRRGLALAALTALEGSVYGRFGFGVATRRARVRVDTRAWALRAAPPGRVELVQPAAIGPHLAGVWNAVLRSRRGALAHTRPRLYDATGWNPDASAPDPARRALLHYDAADRVDGYALYAFEAWDPQPRVRVWQLLGATFGVELALWDALAHLDLVTVLVADHQQPDGPVPWALRDPRAWRIDDVRDDVWLRILDPAAALGSRGWDAEGSLVLRVEDPLGLAAGTFALDVRGGTATARPTSAPPGVTLGVEALASAYLGGVPVSVLAAAGRVAGSPEALAAAGRLFAVADPPQNTVFF